MCFKSFFIKILCFILSINFAFCQVQNIELKEISANSDTLQNEFQKYFIDSINSLNIKNDRLNKSKENYNLGLKYFEENNLEKALEYFENSTFYDSTFSKAFFFQGKCLENFNDSLALLSYYKSFELDSLDFAPLYRIAKIYEKHSFLQAINIYNKITTLNKQEHKAFYKLGVLYYLNDSIDLAIENYSISLS